jgi:hypothetical protein
MQPDRRPAIWPWLVMPLIALTAFYCLDRAVREAKERDDLAPAPAVVSPQTSGDADVSSQAGMEANDGTDAGAEANVNTDATRDAGSADSSASDATAAEADGRPQR